jgi:hypothetical protein
MQVSHCIIIPCRYFRFSHSLSRIAGFAYLLGFRGGKCKVRLCLDQEPGLSRWTLMQFLSVEAPLRGGGAEFNHGIGNWSRFDLVTLLSWCGFGKLVPRFSTLINPSIARLLLRLSQYALTHKYFFSSRCLTRSGDGPDRSSFRQYDQMV